MLTPQTVACCPYDEVVRGNMICTSSRYPGSHHSRYLAARRAEISECLLRFIPPHCAPLCVSALTFSKPSRNGSLADPRSPPSLFFGSRPSLSKTFQHPQSVPGRINVSELGRGAFLQLSDTAWDLGIMGVALIFALSWVRLFDELARKNILEQKLSRKLVHISTGLLFMLSWPLFSAAPTARFYAAVVPSVSIIKLLLLGTGVVRDDAAVRALSREGNPRELLRGPLYYIISVSSITMAFWLKSPVGAISLALLCGGDGMADIVGRRFGSSKLPWNKHKSWAGSLAMFLTGSFLAMGFLVYFSHFGYPIGKWTDDVVRVALIALGATFVESLPISTKLDDNLTVPVTAVFVGSVLYSIG